MDRSVFYSPGNTQNTDLPIKSTKIMQHAWNFAGDFVKSICSHILISLTSGQEFIHLLALQDFNDLVCKLSIFKKNLEIGFFSF